MTSGAGGKAAGLETAEQTGLSVPSWTVLPADLFAGWARRAGALDAPDAATALERAEACALTDAELDAVHRAYRGLGAARIAVRSSGLEEDGAAHSHAGVYLTALNVSTAADVADAVRACWISAFSPRAASYLAHRTGDAGSVGMAVVLQVMVESARSGVLFTRDPNTREQRAVISCVYGLGEGLVSGAVDADTIYVGRDSGDVLESHRGLKEEAVVSRSDGSGVGFDPVGAARRDRLALTEEEIAELWRAGRALETRAGCAQDVEWAYDSDGKLWILQSRPITAMAPAQDAAAASVHGGAERLWDNSNIIESFGAVTAPLTFSFAQHVYHRVYRDYARLLGVPDRELAAMDTWLRSMLGWFDGHVYYNLLNWYKVIRLLPGYRTNRKILELQMGLGEPLDDELALAQQPLTPRGRARTVLVRTRITANFARHFVGMHRSASAFVRYFEKQFHTFEDELGALEQLDSVRILDRYQDLEEDLLRRFGRMILLEATIAMSYGAFQTLVDRWAPDTPDWVRWDAVRPRRPMASSTAVRTLERIATHVRGLRPEVRASLEQSDVDHYAALRELGERELLGMIDDFIAAYGYRSANELKLEAPDMRDDPEIFFALLRGSLDVEAQQERPATGKPARLLGGARGWVLEQVRKKSQVSLEDREDVRFCRSRAFGMVRRMVTAIGADLVRIGALADVSDIFYLEFGELEKYVRGAATAAELAPLVALRRERFGGFSHDPGRPRFTTHGVPYWGQSDDGHPRAPQPGTDSGDAELCGIGCVPGVVDGRAAVVTEPKDVDGGILVTYRTDPGWITALPTARGLVIERGSPLTHVAIAAREFGIPTIVQVPGVTAAVTNGERLRIDGERGTVTMRGEGS